MVKSKVEVAIIGAVSVDIFGVADLQVIARDSNPGKVNFSFGGVGRNIAHNLAKLGVVVELLAVIGDDENADKLIEHCESEHIGLTHSLFTAGDTPVYMSINENNGDMYAAIADFDLVKKMDVVFLTSKLAFLNSCQVVVVDTNLDADIISFLLEHITSKVFVDPVSTTKGAKLKTCLGLIDVFKPNLLEAQSLLSDNLSYAELVKGLHNQGVKEVYLTLGEKGVYLNGEVLDNFPGNIVNTTGCGDAFLAGIIYGELKGYNQLQKAKCGLAAASICAMSTSSISENLNRELLEGMIWN